MTFILNRPDYSSEAALKVYDKIDADDYGQFSLLADIQNGSLLSRIPKSCLCK